MTEDDLLPKLRIMQTCPIDFGDCKKREEIEKEFNPSQFFLDIPYGGYNKKNERTIKSAIQSYGLTPVLAEDRSKAEGLLCNVCKTIQKSGYAVADISRDGYIETNQKEYNPNVMFELGIIFALGKKFCIIRNNDTIIPPDLSGLIINKYVDKRDIEKNVSKWIIDNVSEIAIKIAKQRKIYEFIYLQLENENFYGEEIGRRINEIKDIGNINVLIEDYNRVIGKLINFLMSDNPDVKFEAVEALGEIGGAKAVEALLESLKEKEAIFKWRVIENLGNIGDNKAVNPLIATLSDSKVEIRRAAAKALGKIGDNRATEPLFTTLKDEDSYTRKEAAEALGKIGDFKAVESLIITLKDEHPMVRKSAAVSLGLIGDIKAVEPLIMALEDEDQHVRRIIVDSLGQIGDIKAIEPLIKALRDEDIYVQGSAVDALGKIGDIKAIVPLTDLLSDKNKYNSVEGNIKDAIEKIKSAQKEKKEKQFRKTNS